MEEFYRYQRITELYWFINGLRAQKSDSGLPTIFLRCSGHIGEIQVDIYENGWEEPVDEEFYVRPYSFYLNTRSPLYEWDDCIKMLERALKKVREHGNN